VNVLTLALLVLSVAVLAGGLALVRRGRKANWAWTVAIAEHVEATGDYPTVAELRAGRWATLDPAPAGPVTVTVTVLDGPRPQLSGGAR
jgi:hypothetical protein